jgi:hypothetical protein
VTDFNTGQGDRILLKTGVAYNMHAEGSDLVIGLTGATITLVGVSEASLGDWLVRV